MQNSSASRLSMNPVTRTAVPAPLWARVAWPRTVLGAIATYAVVIALCLFALLAWLRFTQYTAAVPSQGADRPANDRVAYFEQHSAAYDVVFLGDSKTYCGIHPEFIDPLLGTRSINLSIFSNWFPTQYPLARDVLRAAKPGTTVVWSIGHVNFHAPNGIWRVYPVDFATALKYKLWRVPDNNLWDNVLYYNAWTQPIADRKEWNARLHAWLQWQYRPDGRGSPGGQPLSGPPAGTVVDPFAAAAAALAEQWRQDPRATTAQVVLDGGHTTSVTAFLRGGGYYRIELDHAFFRGKQKATPLSDERVRDAKPLQPDPGMWRLFVEILTLFKNSQVELVVNELEEAPYTYGHPLERERLRNFMRTQVQPLVEGMGFKYVRADFAQVLDTDYFDYNHLNSSGVQKYAPLLAERLRPLVTPRPR